MTGPQIFFRILTFTAGESDWSISCVHGLLELTHLQLDLIGLEIPPDMLTSLCSLRELCKLRRLKPVVISSAAELTKLIIEGLKVSYRQHVPEAAPSMNHSRWLAPSMNHSRWFAHQISPSCI